MSGNRDVGPAFGRGNGGLNFNPGAAVDAVEKISFDGITDVEAFAVFAVDPLGGAFSTGKHGDHQGCKSQNHKYDAHNFLHKGQPSFHISNLHCREIWVAVLWLISPGND